MTKTKKLGILTLGLAGFATATLLPMSALGQVETVRQQDISDQLQSSLEAAAPTIVFFDFDKSDLTAETMAVLDQQVSWLVSNPVAKVDLAGHTDAVGTNTYNDALAMRRAQSVQQYMFERGVLSEQMRSVVSRGEDDLLISTPKRERQNRRVTTRVTGLVDVAIVSAPPQRPAPLPKPTPRKYAESPIPACVGGRSRTSPLVGMEKSSLLSSLETRLDNAATIYASKEAASDLGGTFHTAAFVKMQCGIAIGYAKKGIQDQRSIKNCDCIVGKNG